MINNENINNLLHKFHENRFSHIFLIETNSKKEVLNDLLILIKHMNCSQDYTQKCTKCNICHLIDNQTLPSLSVIYPDGQAIRKSQMEELKLLFSHKPYISKYNIYIINDAEKFNNSSANTMLKFIEEPAENTVGFLITNNKENVIPTIKSRCELVKAFYSISQSSWDPELVNLAISYINNIEIIKTKGIVYNKEILDQDLNKDQMISFFQIILDFYLQLLNGKVIYENLSALSNYNIKKIMQRIQLVNDLLEKLNYNINVNLLMDSFVLSLED